MKLNKLPVLIRTEVTADAAKGVNLPAVYSKALVALEEAISELSFDKLKTVEVSVEGLAAWAKAYQDEKLTKTARELKFRARRTANYIAEQLVKRRRVEFIARGGKAHASGGVPKGEPESGDKATILREANYNRGEVLTILAAARLDDTPENSQLSGRGLHMASRRLGKNIRSDVYHNVFSSASHASRTPFSQLHWFRNNNARGIARQIHLQSEITQATQRVTVVRAWCDEFLKNLPRNVSKAKMAK